MKPKLKNKPVSSVVEALTSEEIKKVLSNSNDRDQLVYIIAAFMGLRLTEILYIELKDIDFNKRVLNYRVAKSDEVTSKFIPDQVFIYLENYVNKYDLNSKKYLFVVTSGCFKGNRVTEDTISKRTKTLFKKLSIGQAKKIYNRKSPLNPIKTAIKHSKTFHSIRHFYATQYYDHTLNEYLTARSLRHSKGNIRTVMTHYVEIKRDYQELQVSNNIVEKVLN